MYSDLIGRAELDKRTWIIIYIISILGHFLVFGMVYVLPSFQFHRDFTPSVIDINLMTLPEIGSPSELRSLQPVETEINSEVLAKASESQQIKRIKPVLKQPKFSKPEPVLSDTVMQTEPEPVTRPLVKKEVKPVVTALTKPKRKESLKKKTFKPERSVKRAISRLEKNSGKKRPKVVNDAINKLRLKVGKSGSLRGGGLRSRRTQELINIYQAEIMYQIQKNWAFSEQMVQGQTNIISTLIIKIMKDGEIRDMWFESKSDNAYLNDTALNAVKKSNPLPPLPKEYDAPFYNVGLVFTPSGIKRGLMP
ncbi:putative TonB C-terminal domain-containing protein [Candidatus Magnetomoraceae bacterium gMMP-15]